MSDDNEQKTGPKSWNRSQEDSQGPERSWGENLEQAADEFVGFLKDSDNKQAIKDFIFDIYKRFESEKVEQFKARVENEAEVDSRGKTDYHQAGNIGPIMSETFNMGDSERSYARGLKATKKFLVRSLDDRVEEINRLLAGIGGFSSQLKSCFARSTVVFLQQEDPKNTYRDQLIFSINLPSFELKGDWRKDENGESQGVAADERSEVQVTWDQAVNTLAKLVEQAGLQPKYCKNDRNYGRFVMKQDLRHSMMQIPDEYFSFTLDYNTDERLKEMGKSYNKIIKDYDNKLQKLEKKLKRYPDNAVGFRYNRLKKKYMDLAYQRDFFVSTVPDPAQLEEGLLFLIEVSTLKDYHIVKDRMQTLMTKFILGLSEIAMKEAEIDPELDFEVWKSKQEQAVGEASDSSSKERSENPNDIDLDSVPEYVVDDESHLQRVLPHKKKSDAA